MSDVSVNQTQILQIISTALHYSAGHWTKRMLRLSWRGRFLGKFVSHLVWTEIADIPPGLGRAGVGDWGDKAWREGEKASNK